MSRSVCRCNAGIDSLAKRVKRVPPRKCVYQYRINHNSQLELVCIPQRFAFNSCISSFKLVSNILRPCYFLPANGERNDKESILRFCVSRWLSRDNKDTTPARMAQPDSKNTLTDWQNHCFPLHQWVLHTKNIMASKKAIHTLFSNYFTVFPSQLLAPRDQQYLPGDSSGPGADQNVCIGYSGAIESRHSTVASEHINRLKPVWLSEAGSSREAIRSTYSKLSQDPFDKEKSSITKYRCCK